MAAIARNNAFGAGAPSWNLSFPAGELTAAEITAYCPHWLKSIDVVNRFLCHGARTVHIAALLNEFRNFPDNRIFSTNSTLVMMSYAMRKAGFDGWCVMTHFEYSREHFLPESGLSVTNFRTPCTTQPRDVTSEDSHRAVNQEVRPVPFKDLAKHVKKHPSGDDALDLARCVQYAVKHPDEVWLFPTDFQSLTAHLGGPTTITPAHLDEEVFARRDDVKIPTTKRKRSTAIKPISKNKQPVSQQQTNKQLTGAHSFINILSKPGPSQPRKRGNDHLAANDTNSAEECEAVHEENELFGQLAKKRKLSRGRSLFNSYIDDDEFLPNENEASEDIPKKGFGGPEQSELPHNEVNGSVALHKARDGKRAAVEPETVAPQLDLGHNYVPRQPDLLDNYEQDLNFAPKFGQQLGVASSYAQQSNAASGYGQRSNLPNVHNQQPCLPPTYGQKPGIPSNHGHQSIHSSTCVRPSRCPSGYNQEFNSISPDQQLGLPYAYGQQSSLSSTSVEVPTFPCILDQQPVLPFTHCQQFISTLSNGQTSGFPSVFDQDFNFLSNYGQQLVSASSFSQNPSFANNIDGPQLEFPLSSESQRPSVASSIDQLLFNLASNEKQPPFSLASTFDQTPLNVVSNDDQFPHSFVSNNDHPSFNLDTTLSPDLGTTFTLDPTSGQIPLDFSPTFDQKPSDYNPSLSTQQVEHPNLFEQYTQPYTEPYVQPYATTADPLPVLLTPPILPANRLQITSQNIHHYALPPFASQSDMWTTAFHYKRFGGARQSAPYRELHTLCCLDENDTGDWAENIRFATEQWLYYGTIWTEFEGHLKKIRKARLEWGWKSPEAIRADAKKGSRAA